MFPMKVLIVIVNYKTADMTLDCLKSLAPEVARLSSASPSRVDLDLQTPVQEVARVSSPSPSGRGQGEGARDNQNVRVAIVDNASGDGSPAKIQSAINACGFASWASLLPLEHNIGF